MARPGVSLGLAAAVKRGFRAESHRKMAGIATQSMPVAARLAALAGLVATGTNRPMPSDGGCKLEQPYATRHCNESVTEPATAMT